MKRVACVSTGNTSASMAAYASAAGLDPLIFIPHGNISYGKLAQALEYGAKTFQVDGATSIRSSRWSACSPSGSASIS